MNENKKKVTRDFTSLKIGYIPKVDRLIYRAIFEALDRFGELPKYIILGYQTYINLAAWVRERQPVSTYDLHLDYKSVNEDEVEKVDRAFEKIDDVIKNTLDELDVKPDPQKAGIESSFVYLKEFAGVPLIVDPKSKDRVTAIVEPTMLVTAFVALSKGNDEEATSDKSSQAHEFEEFIDFLKMMSDIVDKKENN